MSIESVAAVSANAFAEVSPVKAPADTGTLFQTVLDGIHSVNRQIQSAEQTAGAFATGQTDELHHVMMGMEQTRLSFEMLLQVRNKVLEAYQELMRMQI